jgi:hypothetical protein
MFYGQWGEHCSLQRKKQYFLDEDGKDKKSAEERRHQSSVTQDAKGVDSGFSAKGRVVAGPASAS